MSAGCDIRFSKIPTTLEKSLMLNLIGTANSEVACTHAQKFDND